MKNLIVILSAFFILSIHDGYAQDPFRFNKQEASALLKNHYLFQYFRHPGDTTATLNRFVETVNKIVPISEQKKDSLKVLLLTAIRQDPNRETSVNDQMHNLPLIDYSFIPLMGANANNVIKNNFSWDEYRVIYNTILSDRIIAKDAYWDLKRIYKKEVYAKSDIMFTNDFLDPKYVYDLMFDAYGL